MQVKLPFQSLGDCRKKYRKDGGREIVETQICAGGERGKSMSKKMFPN